MKSRSIQNAKEMYSIHNEGKSAVAERCIRTLKNKFFKYMTSISKNVYTDKLDDIVNKYNNIYHRINKMKPVGVKPSLLIDFNKENKVEDPKFNVGDHVRISEYKHIFAKGYVPNCSEELIKILCHGHMLLVILMTKKLLSHFMIKNCKENLELKK